MTDAKVLISESDIQRRVRELADEISRDYAGKEITLVGVLKGAFIFLSDLARHLKLTNTIEFMSVSSYGASTTSSGQVRVLLDLRTSIEGKHVLVVEDIVDTGLTLHYLLELLAARDPASLKTCALVRKKERHEIEIVPDYLGFDIPNVWVVGYGLDYAELYRALPFIGVIDPLAEDSATG
jgi:hypoxanthine phosphoribosyltransferase